MLSCREFTEQATDYLEGDLPWRERLRVRIHLWMCRHCRAFIGQMRTVVRMLRRLPAEPAPPQLIEKLTSEFRQARDKQA